MKSKEKEKRKIRYHQTHQANKELKWKILSEYVAHFGEYHLPWLHELAEKYKARGVFPTWAVITLPAYYEDVLDKEVAAFAGVLLPEGCTYEQIQELREMLGEHPWEWFKTRGFVQLSLGDVQNYRTGGVQNWKIARFFDLIWKECRMIDPLRDEDIKRIAHTLWKLQSRNIMTVYGAMYYMVGDLARKPSFNLRLLANLYVYDFKLLCDVPFNLKCPIADGIREFIKTWIPDYRGQMGTLDEAISLFGFKYHSDFLFAYLGYEELKKKYPKQCSAYATAYHRWYMRGIKKRESEWKAIQPKIKL